MPDLRAAAKGLAQAWGSATQAAGRAYRDLDRRIGILPGGGTANAASGALRSAAAGLRDAAIGVADSAYGAGLIPGNPAAYPFARYLTGTDRPLEQLDPRTMRQLPANIERARSLRKGSSQGAFAVSGYPDTSERDPAGNSVRLVLGNYSAVQVPGGYKAMDIYDVDALRDGRVVQCDAFGGDAKCYRDLVEGGKAASDLVDFARGAGLINDRSGYPVNVRVPRRR